MTQARRFLFHRNLAIVTWNFAGNVYVTHWEGQLNVNFFKDHIEPKGIVTIPYSEAYIAPALLSHCRDAIKLLCRAVAAAQGGEDPGDKHIDAALQSLIGFAALSIGEALALLALVSIGLERQARIHLRALNEFKAKAELLLGDPEKAFQLKLAATKEIDRFVELASVAVKPEDIANAKQRFLGDLEKEIPKREKAVVGDMATVMKKSYLADYAYLSLLAHGSVLALDEMSKALSLDGPDITKKIGVDHQAGLYLLTATTTTLELVCRLIKELNVNVADEWDALCEVNEKLLREFIVVPETPLTEQQQTPHNGHT